MRLVRISGSASRLDKVIQACCSVGSFQPENAADFVSSTMGYEPMTDENPYTETIGRINDLAGTYGFSLESSEKSKKINVDQTTAEFITDIGSEIRELAQRSVELDEQANECRKAVEEYSHFLGLGLDFKEIFDCKFIAFRFGRLPRDGYIKFMRAYSDNADMLFLPSSSDDVGYWGAYLAPIDGVAKVDRIFASLQFERLIIPKAVGTAEEIVDNLNKNIEIVDAQKAEIDAQIKELWAENEEKIKAIYLRLLDLNTIYEVKKRAVFHSSGFFLVGWIPVTDENKLNEKLSIIKGLTVDIEDPSANGKVMPPTKLKNIILFRPFEFFVEMYGLPSYDELDITSFVAITYTLLFGIMFGDVGQGLLVFIIGLILYKKSGSGLGKILVPCGLSSSFFGLVFGSVFGFEEALDPLYHALGMKGKPLEVMDSINTVLLVAISIGIALVIVAMIMCVAINLKKKKIGTALFSESGLTGIVTYLGGVSLVYQFMAKKAIIPSSIAAAMLAGGLIILFNKEIIAGSIDKKKFIKPEKLGDYIMQNFFEVFEYVLSYFSNTVSFLRVGAFVIVHASMMMVVFTLAGDTSSVKGIIVVILGNALVVALEGLLSGIQGLRLEFYEMFSRFYEGEGKPFNPISLASRRNNQKTTVKSK